MFQATVSRKGTRHYFPEIALALGPQIMGQAGNGTYAELCAVSWAIVWDRARGVVLLSEQSGSWAEIMPGEAFPALGTEDRHVSLCFDQAARHVFTWQRGQQFTVRQWNAADDRYVYQGPFSGVDPTLFFDLTSHYQPSRSDVVVWYLSPDRLTLCYRIQNELYAAEHVACIFTAPVWIDQVVSLPYRAQVLVTDAQGTPQVIVVGIYDYAALDRSGAVARPPGGGELFEVVIARQMEDAVQGETRAPSSGELFEVIIARQMEDAVPMPALAPSSGELFDVILAIGALNAVTASSSAPTAGALVLVIVTYTSAPDPMTAGAKAPTGGTLATA